MVHTRPATWESRAPVTWCARTAATSLDRARYRQPPGWMVFVAVPWTVFGRSLSGRHARPARPESDDNKPMRTQGDFDPGTSPTRARRTSATSAYEPLSDETVSRHHLSGSAGTVISLPRSCYSSWLLARDCMRPASLVGVPRFNCTG